MMLFPASRLSGLVRRAVRRAALLAVLAAPLGAWTAEPEWLVRNWQTEDGLPDANVTAIQQTPDGYLWVGTPKGLVRFDGAQFTAFDGRRVPVLADEGISALLVDRRGALWIGCESGRLLRFEHGRFEPISLPGLPDPMPAAGFVKADQGETRFRTQWMWGHPTVLVEDEAGGIWSVTASNRLLRCQGGQAALYTPTNGLPPGELGGLSADRTGQVWLAAGNGLFCWRGGQWTSLENAAPLGGPLSRLAAARQGGIWAAAPRGSWLNGGGLVRRFEAGQGREQLEPTPSTPNPLRSQVTTLLEDHVGRVWLGLLWNGIWFSEFGHPWRRLQTESPLSQSVIACLYEDRQGSVWVGTVGEGLHRISRRPVTMLKLPAPAQESIITTSCAARDGSLWVGTDSAGAFRYTDEHFVAFGNEQGLSDQHVCSIFEDSHTNLWFGTWGGLFHFDQGRFMRVEGPPELRLEVLAIFEDRARRLWVGTPRGLVCRRDRDWSVQRLLAGDDFLDIRSVAEDADGDLWVGTIGQGLFRLRENQVAQFRHSEGFTSKDARSLYCDPAGVLWVGSHYAGLFRFQDGQFTAYTTADGLPCNTIMNIFPDAAGNLWMGSDNGIFACSPAALKAYQRGTSLALLCVRLTLAEGLGSRACSGGGQPLASRSADGRFWVPNMHGLAVFDPRAVAVQQLPLGVRIESVVADGTELAPAAGGEVRARSSTWRFEFHYTVPDLVAPQALRFRYKLEGMDRDWVDAKSQRAAYYSQLPPGQYQFRVMAGGADGHWHETAAPLLLRVVPRLWEVRWVQVLAGMLLIAAVIGSILLNERRKHRRRLAQIQQERALEQERQRIAANIHDDLGASLTRITLLSDIAYEQAVAGGIGAEMEQIHTTSRELTRAMDEIVWAVAPDHDTMDSLVSYLGKVAQDALRPAGVRCRLAFPATLPDLRLSGQVRHSVFLAVKEALHNVVKHAAATEARLQISLQPGAFIFVVADNGRGFDPAAGSGPDAGRPTTVSGRISTGHGLKNMSMRLREIGGQCEVVSVPGAGTEVRLRVPLNAGSHQN